MFGSHLSIAGGLHNALSEACRLGMETVQVFTKNQQQWKVPSLSEEAIARWRSELRRVRFRKTASHASYLINLASPDELLWRRSIELFIEELRRCELLGIAYCVIHPGSHMGLGEEFGMKRVVAALDVVHSVFPAGSVMTCLESTAGQGSSIGHRLEQLAEIISRSRCSDRLGVCLDTAHLFAGGYDFRGRRYGHFRKAIGRVVGLRQVKVLHLNDSKKSLGSRVDRHEHIGHGAIGLEGFRPFVRDSLWARVPKILETPKEESPDGRDWDTVNIETLMSLA